MGGESRAGMIMMTTKSEYPEVGYALVEEGDQSNSTEEPRKLLQFLRLQFPILLKKMG